MLLKIVIALALAAGVGNIGQYFWAKWQASRYEARIATLESEAEANRVAMESKQAQIDHLQATLAARGKKVNVQKKIDETVGTHNPGRVIELFSPYRVQQPQDRLPDTGVKSRVPAQSPIGAPAQN